MATQYTGGLTAGQVLNAATMNQIGAAWESYTPVWSSSGTNPTLGNGSISGSYTRIQKLVIAQCWLVIGGTTTFGTGAYYVTVPVAAVSPTPFAQGFGILLDASAGYAGYMGVGIFPDTTKLEWRFGNAAQVWQQTVPVTLAAGDQIRMCMIYEGA